MKEKQEIITRYFNKGESQRKIARKMGIHRITVKSYVEQYTNSVKRLLESGEAEKGEIIDEIIKKPKYDSSTRKRQKVTEEIEEKIKDYLKLNRQKRSDGQRKQQLKKKDIHDELKEKGFDIGYTTVCDLVNILDERTREAFIKQHYQLGEVCEFDWGEVKIYISGKLEKYQMSVFTSAAGNHRYGRLYKKQDTRSFHHAHAKYFENIGGVYQTLVYDNTRVVIKKFVGPNEKEATEGLLKLSSYYNFDFRFCNARKGNEKGHVERSMEYVRRKAFCVKDRFESLEEANDHLETICSQLNNKPQTGNENRSAFDILEEEKPYLLPSRPFFDCSEIRQSHVDKYSTISLDTCHYSVPEKYVGKIVSVKVYPDKLICSSDDGKICEHQRLFGFHDWSIKVEHYIETLRKKPGALHNSLAMRQLGERLQNVYKSYYLKQSKDFIELIEYMKKNSMSVEKIESAITQIRKITPLDITTDKIKIICERKTGKKLVAEKSEIEKSCETQLSILAALLPNSENLNRAAEVMI